MRREGNGGGLGIGDEIGKGELLIGKGGSGKEEEGELSEGGLDCGPRHVSGELGGFGLREGVKVEGHGPKTDGEIKEEG